MEEGVDFDSQLDDFHQEIFLCQRYKQDVPGQFNKLSVCEVAGCDGKVLHTPMVENKTSPLSNLMMEM